MNKLIRGILGSGLVLATSAAPVFAQAGGKFTFPGLPVADLGLLLKNMVIILFLFAALLSFIFIVLGGIQWITAGGDKMAAQAARDRITSAVVGLVIVVAAFAITIIVTTALGINIFTGTIKLPSAPSVFQ